MDLKSIATTLANLGLPILGAAIAGPAGAVAAKGLLAAIGLSKDSTPEQVAATLGSLNGDQLTKLKELETDLAKAQLAAATAQVEAVNKTLQAEQAGGSFWQRNHHAFECSAFIVFVIGVYFVLPLLKIAVPVIPEFAFMAVGSVLGVTAWQRGKTSQILADQS
jgi:hypothetical protein